MARSQRVFTGNPIVAGLNLVAERNRLHRSRVARSGKLNPDRQENKSYEPYSNNSLHRPALFLTEASNVFDHRMDLLIR
jgi:hypothetical protein